MRDQWRPDSAFTTNLTGVQSFVESNTITAVASGPVAAGELVTLFESGALLRTDPTLPWSAINQNDTAPLAILPATPVPNIVIVGRTTATACGYPARLLNNTYAVPMQTSSGVGFTIRSSSGLQITNYVNASSDTSNCIPYAIPLQNGNFVLVWINTSGTLKFMVFTPQGVVVTTATTVASSVYVASSVPWAGNCILGNGNFVITYSTVAGGVYAQIYTNAGATVGSLITLDASLNGGWHTCIPCANGDFLASCFDVTHSAFKIWRVTNAGSITWGPIIPSGSGTALFTQPAQALMGPEHNRLVELTGGNIAWMLPNASSYANAFILTSAGSLSSRLDFGTTYHDADVQAPLVWTPNGFAVSHGLNSSPNTYASFYDVNGAVLLENQLVDTSSYVFPNNTSPVVNYWLGFGGSSLAISRYAALNGGVEIRLLQTDHRGVLIAPPVTHQGAPIVGNNPGPLPTNDACAIIPNAGLDGMVFSSWYAAGSAALMVTSYKTGRSSLFGYNSGSAVAAGGAITVSSSGYVALPSTQIFGPGNAFDQRAQPIMGARGTVGGQQAWLFGWGS